MSLHRKLFSEQWKATYPCLTRRTRFATQCKRITFTHLGNLVETRQLGQKWFSTRWAPQWCSSVLGLKEGAFWVCPSQRRQGKQSTQVKKQCLNHQSNSSTKKSSIPSLHSENRTASQTLHHTHNISKFSVGESFLLGLDSLASFSFCWAAEYSFWWGIKRRAFCCSSRFS